MNVLHLATAVLGFLTLFLVLRDAFETIVLPRTVTRRRRFTVMYYRTLYRIFVPLVRRTRDPDAREQLLGAYGPLSLLGLFVLWAVFLITGFALVHWGCGVRLSNVKANTDFVSALYFSGVTFLTLGFGDITPQDTPGRVLAVLEAGVGFGFLAVVIGYLPVIYNAFSRREVGITLLDARAGAPPTATELLWRHSRQEQMAALVQLLAEWEHWSAELLEGILSYPVLAFYRSQHDQQSWLGSLTAILDTCTLALLHFEGDPEWEKALRWQAHLTFAMARHAVIDLSLIFFIPPDNAAPDRLPRAEWERVRAQLASGGLHIRENDEDAYNRLALQRRQYEPYIAAAAERLFVTLPPWIASDGSADNWQTSAWDDGKHF